MENSPTTEASAAQPQAQRHPFQAEVSQVLRLVIHSLYSHKEIFLRELISNASDALDKLRFRALTEPELLKGDPSLEIRIMADREAGTLTIEDSGIGMNQAELIENLGTIAHSGSRAFLEQLAARAAQNSKDAKEPQASKDSKDVGLIGQFGVGFYSSYLVADQVEVVSRSATASEAFLWSSDAKEGFTVEPTPREARGTSVVLHLRDDQKEFLEEWRLRELVVKYSDFVSHPIKLRVQRRAPAVSAVPEGSAVSEGSDASETATKPPQASFETVNQASALWQRSKSEITDEQYAEFYRHVSHDHQPPLARTHFVVEGTQQFVGLLFVPAHAPPGMQSRTQSQGIRLFVKRVFIMDDCEQLIPEWLRFVRGVVDSDDLPLNVSREILQDSAAMRTIRKQVTKRVLDLLDEIAKDRAEDYSTFWKQVGSVLKSGLAIDYEYRERIGKLLRYQGTHGEGLTSLTDYVSRMKEGQEAIYYIFGESVKSISNSPHLEGLRSRGYEVLYMTDPVDEWASNSLGQFDGKPLVSAMRADLKLSETPEEKQQKQASETSLKPLLEHIQAVLSEHVREVRLSERLTDSPCCLVIGDAMNHAYLERLLREKGHSSPKTKRVLEINPTHPLIKNLATLRAQNGDSSSINEWIELLYDQALLTEGNAIEDPNRFAKRVTDLLASVAQQAAVAVVAQP
ncbi:MAG: molecular chaperone HtpG [Polyangiales bacterium]